MSAVSITCRRTLSRARNLLTTALAVSAFLAVAAAWFAFRLASAEGTPQLLSVVWATSVAPFLPLLAAFLGMDVWSDEHRTGRMDVLLATAVRERHLVFGKTLAVWLEMLLVILLSLVLTLAVLAYQAPSALSGSRTVCFLPALFVLFLQGALWAAVSTAASAMCRRAFSAAALTTFALVLLPRGLWYGLSLWTDAGRSFLVEMPVDAHVADIASGMLSTGTILTYALLVVTALFANVKIVAFSRQRGWGARTVRASTLTAILLSLVCAFSLALLANRLDVTFDLPVGQPLSLSPRLRSVLSESSGHLTVTAFLGRKDPNFRPLSQFLRALKRQADSVGGLDVETRFVDPHWDLGAADHLVRKGAPESSLVFEKGHRFLAVPIADGYGDRNVAAAIQRVALPPLRQAICWTTGHGEASFDAYGTWGMSDMARELVRNGYRTDTLDFADGAAVPSDCALVVIAGAKDAFSRAELGRLDAYLKSGGRLLVMMGPTAENGVAAMLPRWGIRPKVQPISGARTLSGSNVIVDEFAEHPVTAELGGARIVLEKPVSFAQSAVGADGAGADRLDFTPVARVGQATVVAAVERGAQLGTDLAIRPTRIVAIGDPTFVMNGQLAARASANRDFFLNAVSYLAGSETLGANHREAETLLSGMDRDQRVRFAVVSCLVMPGSVFILMMLVVLRRRFLR